jgi:hypothetical protein
MAISASTVARSRAVFTLAGLLLSSQLQALPGFAYTRDLNVPAAGWVRVPLDLAALRHMASGGADARILSPGGAVVPFRLGVALPASGRQPLVVRSPEPEDTGWVQVLETGGASASGTAPHERLILTLALNGPLPALSLDGSPDGTDWQPLAAGVPARLEGLEGLQRLSLSYPSTPDRFVRIHWPAGPAPPGIAAAEVETVNGPTLALATGGARCVDTASGAVCMLELPAGQIVRRIAVELKGAGPVGYRLYEARDAHWEPLAESSEGVWQPGPTGERSRHVISGGPKPVEGSVLRLELYAPEEAPTVVGYVLDLAVPTILFQAREPGRYTLAYGGIGGAAAPALSRIQNGTWVEPGPEQESPPPPLPEEPGAALDRIRFSDSWTVTAPNAGSAENTEPGVLVRLELPAAVYAAAREDLADLRLSVAGRQIPFFRWSPPDPVLTAGTKALHPAESERPGESRVVVSLPTEELPLTQIDLTAPGSSLRRPVTVLFVDPDRRSRRSGRAVREPAARATWVCDPQPPLPCRESLPLRGTAAPRLLTIRFRDGDNPRLPSVDVSVWRRRDVLLFVWPKAKKGEAVRLQAGAPSLEAPRYDLAALGPALLGHAWEPAEIRSADEAPEPPWWNRWVMPLAITAAMAWLLILLRRILSEA